MAQKNPLNYCLGVTNLIAAIDVFAAEKNCGQLVFFPRKVIEKMPDSLASRILP